MSEWWVNSLMVDDDTIVDRIVSYWRHNEAEEWGEAADQFHEDVTYIHTAMHYDLGIQRVEGRDSLLYYFSDIRGPRSIYHHLDRAFVDGDDCMLIGTATGDDMEGVSRFFVYAEADPEDGRIAYYEVGNRAQNTFSDPAIFGVEE
jgi:hypothetical protein